MYQFKPVRLILLAALLIYVEGVIEFELKLSPPVPFELDPLPTNTNGSDSLDAENLGLAKRQLEIFKLVPFDLKGYPGQGYYVPLKIGTPGQEINVLIDTGSSNLAVAGAAFPGATRWFRPGYSTTYKTYDRHIMVRYTQGSWTGALGRDTVLLPGSIQLTNQSAPVPVKVAADFATIIKSDDFFLQGAGWEGILGLAYAALARPVDLKHKTQTIMDDMVEQLGLPDVFSVLLCGTTVALSSTSSTPAGTRLTMHGTLVVGGLNASHMTGPLLYSPLRQPWYYEVVMTDLRVGGRSVVTDCKELNMDKTIVDTGTTDIRLPHRVFAKTVSLLKQALGPTIAGPAITDKFWEGKVLLCQMATTRPHLGGPGGTPYRFFPEIDFELLGEGGQVISLVLSPQQYIRFVGQRYDGVYRRDCFRFGFHPSDFGTVLGATLMEGFYTVFDRAKKRVGFAQSPCNRYAQSPMIPVSRVLGPRPYSKQRAKDCAYDRASRRWFMGLSDAVSIALGVLCVVILMPALLLLLYLQCQSARGSRSRSDSPSTEHNDKSRLVP